MTLPTLTPVPADILAQDVAATIQEHPATLVIGAVTFTVRKSMQIRAREQQDAGYLAQLDGSFFLSSLTANADLIKDEARCTLDGDTIIINRTETEKINNTITAYYRFNQAKKP
jgi:hypothetical protein